MIKALTQDYSSLGPRRSIAARIPSFAVAQAAILLGISVSFDEIMVSAIVGSGAAAGNAGISRRKVLFTIAPWAGSLTAHSLSDIRYIPGYWQFKHPRDDQ